MGRGYKRRRAEREDRAPRPSAGDGDGESVGGWKDIVPHNDQFEKYYRDVNPLAGEDWLKLHESLKTPLPATFRLSGTPREAAYLRDLFKTRFFSKMEGLVVEGRPIDPPMPVPWIPDERVWQFGASRREIRGAESLAEFHKILVQESDEGNVMRQELVSMIPPLLLDVQPGMRVLDMCAAPGSKTAQLIEALHGTDQRKGIPTGLVIANDVDVRRCHMLVHQTKRLQSPCCVVTNHDATMFPQLYGPPEAGSDGERTPIQFDRILCDAPCSGDGTLRKNPMIWRTWSPNSGMALHRTQIKILYRGLQLLKVGGRLVYSTCSFNPIENEAVVATVLGMCPGALRLVDVSQDLPLLKREHGWTSWHVMSKNSEVYSGYAGVPEEARSVILPSMFPPEAAVAEDMGLVRCLRVLPHVQNTGGFFIAVFEKTGPIGAVDKQLMKRAAAAAGSTAAAATDAAPADAAPAVEQADGDASAGSATSATAASEAAKEDKPMRQPRKKARQQHKEDPYVLVNKDSHEVALIQRFYALDDFPYELLVGRSENEKRRNLSIVSRDVYDLMRTDPEQLRIVNMGVRLFTRHPGIGTGDSMFRIMQDGLPYLYGMLGRKAINLSLPDLEKLLQDEPVLFTELSVQRALENTSYGCCVFTADLVDAQGQVFTTLALSGWRGKTSAHLLVSKRERSMLMWRVNPERAHTELHALVQAELEKKAQARAANASASAAGAADEANSSGGEDAEVAPAQPQNDDDDEEEAAEMMDE